MSFLINFNKIIKIYFLKYRPLKIEKFRWEKEFNERHWDYLYNIKQLSRYSVITGYFDFFFPTGGKILDVGCGQGVLYQRFKKLTSIKYVGLDISEAAINLAKLNSLNNGTFHVADLIKYSPDSTFDFIIFNESLYYIDNPIMILQKYANYLNDGGKIIVSMWDNKERNNKIWHHIEKKFNLIDGLYLKNLNAEFGWMIKIFDKKI